MTTNTAANAAMRDAVGANTGTGGPHSTRMRGLGETYLDMYGNAWIYGKNSTGSTLSAGQIAASYSGAFTTGTGAVIDKDVADGKYYEARLLEAGIGLTSDVVPTVAFAAGAANVCTITVTWKDRSGNTVKGVRAFDIYLSDAATGAGLTSSAISGEVVATTGASLATVTTHKRWTVQSAATGIFVGSMTDTAKTQGLYVCVVDPQTGLPIVSASATVTASYG